MDQPHNSQEKEINLIPVFQWISNGFKNFFNAIGRFFKALFHFFVLFLIFIQKNVIVVAICAIAGAALGWYFNQGVKESYTAQAVVQTNFGSAKQLYANVKKMNTLADQSNYDELAQLLGIDVDAASHIKSISIVPEYNDTELLREYDHIARKSDTMALEVFTFEAFKNAKRPIDFEYHKIEVNGTKNDALNKVVSIAIDIPESNFIKSQRSSQQATARFDVMNMEYEVAAIDSVIMAYQTALKSKKDPSAGTNLFISENQSPFVFKHLFDQKKELLAALAVAREQQFNYDHVINIVSSYTQKGTPEKQHLTIKGGFAGIGFGLILAVIPLLWRSLKEYEQQHA